MVCFAARFYILCLQGRVPCLPAGRTGVCQGAAGGTKALHSSWSTSCFSIWRTFLRPKWLLQESCHHTTVVADEFVVAFLAGGINFILISPPFQSSGIFTGNDIQTKKEISSIVGENELL